VGGFSMTVLKTPKQFKECAKSAVKKCIHEALKHGFVEEFKKEL